MGGLTDALLEIVRHRTFSGKHMTNPNHDSVSPETSFDPFAQLSEAQQEKLSDYERQLRRFNQRVNLISPDTERHISERHVLHSLALTRRTFPAGARIVDWGSGGGLPAVPLAIACPDVEVIAVDSVGKKVRAIRAIARRLGLDNLYAWKGRAENWPDTADYSVSRATAPLAELWRWHRRAARESSLNVHSNRQWQPGLLALKGGDLSDEIDDLREEDSAVRVEQIGLEPLLGREYFAEKCIVAVWNS